MSLTANGGVEIFTARFYCVKELKVVLFGAEWDITYTCHGHICMPDFFFLGGGRWDF